MFVIAGLSRFAWARVVVFLGGGGGGCGRADTKPELSLTQPQIVPDQDAAQRAARALSINGHIGVERGKEVHRQVRVLRRFAQVAHSGCAMLAPSCAVPLLLLAALCSLLDPTQAEVRPLYNLLDSQVRPCIEELIVWSFRSASGAQNRCSHVTPILIFQSN